MQIFNCVEYPEKRSFSAYLTRPINFLLPTKIINHQHYSIIMPPEQPQYILPQNKARAIIPKTVSLIILGIIFYFGILLNISLLKLTGSEETTIQTVSLIVILLAIILGITLSLLNARKKYFFYRNQIQFGKKKILYANITNTAAKQNLFDKIFKTKTIKLSKKFSLKNIPAEIDLQNYLQQLIAYSQKISPKITA